MYLTVIKTYTKIMVRRCERMLFKQGITKLYRERGYFMDYYADKDIASQVHDIGKSLMGDRKGEYYKLMAEYTFLYTALEGALTGMNKEILASMDTVFNFIIIAAIRHAYMEGLNERIKTWTAAPKPYDSDNL